MAGTYVPQLQAVDALLQNFMAGKPIPGGTIAITHDDKVIYERGIGYNNEARTTAMQETALMRLASVSKPITASAIQQLAKDGQLNLNDKVFNIDGNGGILNITPYNGTLGDSRLRDITLQHLLEHKGGWNRDLVGDIADGRAESAGNRQLGRLHLEPASAIHPRLGGILLEHRLHVLGHGRGGGLGTRVRKLCGK
jgi:CubicO group peptidase (beta-lactamase class C family)